MKSLILGILALLATVAQPSFAALNVLACEPEWASLSKELGGDKVDVYTATTALQDPHRIEARPSLIARARRADLMVCTGAELEVGWAPLLLSQSGNPNIQAGRPGYFEAATQVRLIEVPTVIDRSLGDVHPLGNPHLHLDPRNIAKVATSLTERMAELDRANAAYYRERGVAFQQRWKEAVARWEKEVAPLKGIGLITYHKDFNYFMNWAGIRELGNLEPKPGLPPTTAHLSDLLQAIAKNPAQAVIRTPFQDPRAGQFLAEHAKIPAIMVPYTVGGTERAKDLFGLYDDTIARLLPLTQVNTTVADVSLVWPAFIAGLLVTATHVPLGIQVLKRGIVFIDLAVAQIAGLGVIFADWLGWEPHGWAVQVAALSAALAGALLLNITDKLWPEVQEATIGVTFVVAANAAILVLASNPRGSEHLRDLLVGQILWVNAGSLPLEALIYGVILAIWFAFGERIGRIGFYVLFAIAVTVSVQLVGLYLVFTTLVLPALVTRRFIRSRLIACWLLGAVGYASGLALSLLFDLPTGPLVVCTMTMLGILVFAVSSRFTGSSSASVHHNSV